MIDNDKKGGSYETVGSIYYSDGSNTLPSEDVDNSKTPIGILVIPSSHMSDGKARIMSLAEMTEDGVGSLTNHNRLKWSVYGTETSLHNYNQVPYVDASDGTTISKLSSWGYISSDKITDKMTNPNDPTTQWYNTSNAIPSPFNTDGTFNSAYSATSYSDGSISNALSDFNGKSNTTTLVTLGAFCKASVACSRYYTEGTSVGDWYLPAMGELAYIMVRFQTIQNSLTKLGDRAIGLGDYNSFWSSTEYGSRDAYRLYTDGGRVGNHCKGVGCCVRAFLSV